MRVDFQEVAVTVRSTGTCSACGKRTMRTRRFWQTLNPFITAAREALAPIRAEIEKLRVEYHYANYPEAHEVWEALDRIAVHVYPSEDL